MRPSLQSSYIRSARQKHAAQKSYFDDDSEDELLANIEATIAPSDDDVDPLDAYMNEVHSSIQATRSSAVAPAPSPEIVSEQLYDDYEAYYNPDEAAAEDAVEYDSDGVPTTVRKHGKAIIEPLPPIDHSSITYTPFKKNFYQEHPDVAALSQSKVTQMRQSLNLTVSHTSHIPSPIQSFTQSSLDAAIIKEIAHHGLEAPTPIQAQCLPIILSGHDVITLSHTGSGKTYCFLWPMIQHIIAQPQMQLGDGPIGIILAPTRELAAQIHTEAKRYGKVYNIRTVAVVGGEGKYQMSLAVKTAPEIIVATPGRLIDLIADNSTNLRRCTMLVLDEADRMLDLGFEAQIRSICNNIRPDRQTLLFSATMKKKIENFAHSVTRNPVRVVLGSFNMANPDIKQVVEVFPVLNADDLKWHWLRDALPELLNEGKVLVFVNNKSKTESLAERLKTLQISVECLHGDMAQSERSSVLSSFKSGACGVLVATDVAARGLDINNVTSVVNYDGAKNIDTHVHRIGRTGRMGVEGIKPGTAYTLLSSSNEDSSLAVDLLHSLQAVQQYVSPLLQSLAQSNARYHSSRSISTGGKRGLGSAGVGPAMTSAMLAKESNQHAPKSTAAYVPQTSVPPQQPDADAAPRKRKNRFSELFHPEEDQPQEAPTMPPSKSLPGFVRAAASTVNSVSNASTGKVAYNSGNRSQGVSSSKKSRWD